MLASAKPYICAATIVDTGSTDDTPKRIKAAGWQVHKRPWVNFGHNRSEAFALARGTADWLLALDADMTVEIDADFEPDPAVAAYLIEMGDSGMSWRLPLLLRGDLPWESRGAVHEYTILADGSMGDGSPPTRYGSGSRSRHRHRRSATGTPGCWRRSSNATPATCARRSTSRRPYRELGDPRARETYLRRAAMGGFEEEAWYAQYRAALLTEWPGQAAELMAAWDRRPTRLEPLYYLVKGLNERGSHQAAYRLAMVPIVPSEDVLFVEPGVWDWGLMFERSIAAWWVGYREEARLGEALLERQIPDHVRGAVLRNLAFTEPAA